jgi:hypothetical protein
LDKTIGTLAAGYEADLIAVAVNPLDNIEGLRNVTLVMKGGQIYKHRGSARHAQQSVIHASSGLLATSLPLFPSRIQLPVALRADVLLPPRQHVAFSISN